VKGNFFFGKENRYARLYLKKSHSNVFVTFTDLLDKVIVCKTSGNSGIIGSKRKKRVPFALESIVKSLKTYFELYSIVDVEIVAQMRINSFLRTLSKELSHNNINIKGLFFRRS
jgi:ribosomal protein S11